MCNLAGYVGDRPAAPILLDMMERQEGFGGGYYSGLATVADGRLHYRKVVGDIARLRRETDAESLPGTFGIVHSRSNSGGDVEWGHPFVDCRERLAYVANGSLGRYTDAAGQAALVACLADHRFRAQSRESFNDYPCAPSLPSGERLHLSEVMCHLIESRLARGPAEAMRLAYQDYPAEVVGLLIDAGTPDTVIASRVNQPLVIGRDASATYLATTALAFPEGVGDLWRMPALATAAVRRERIEVTPFDPLPLPVAGVFPWERAVPALLAYLSDGKPRGVGEIINVIEPFWPPETVSQKSMMGYELLHSLSCAGQVTFDQIRVPGAAEGIDAPRRRARLVTVPELSGATG